MKKNVHFIIVDDDYGTNTYCSIIIKKFVPGSNVNIFMVPEQALNYIKTVYSEAVIENTILLLDINMPTLSGWDFLDRFELLDEKIKDQITIYIFSSSVDPHDQARARQNNRVTDYIVKPLTKDMIIKVAA